MVLFFVLFFLLINLVILAKLRKKIGGVNFIMHPITISSVFFIIIHLLLPYFQWKEHYFRYKGEYQEDIYVYSILLVGINFLVFISGFFISKSFFKIDKLDIGDIAVKYNLKVKNTYTTLFIYLVGVYFVYDSLVFILSMGVEDYIQDRLTLETGNGLNLLLSHWVYVATILFFYFFITSKKSLHKKIIFLLFLITFFSSYYYYSINSNRNSVFLLLLNLLIFFLFFKRIDIFKMSLMKKIGLTIFIVFSAVFFQDQGRERQVLQREDITAEYGFLESMNGAFGNHENIVWLLEEKNELQYGVTYLAGFLNFIPRSLWNDKPLGSGPVLKNQIIPGSYVVGKEGNSSLTTGFFTESLMNFGIFGMLFFSFFYGKFFKYMYNVFCRTVNRFTGLMYLFIIILLGSQFFYAEFNGFFSRTILTLIPFFILMFLNRKDKDKF